MDRIFNMDNKFFTFMSRVADLIILNLLFIVCCLPIVTIGPAWTAMYYVTLKMARNEESYIVRGFFKSFRENFKQGIAIWLLALVLILVEVMDFQIMSQVSGSFYTVVKYGLSIIAFMLVMVLLYVFPVLAKFVNTVKLTIRNAFFMSLRHLPYTILMLVICVAPFLIMIFGSSMIFSYGILLMFLLGFSTIALINSYFFVKIFDNYIPKDENEEEGDELKPLFDDEDPEALPKDGDAPSDASEEDTQALTDSEFQNDSHSEEE